MRILLLVLILCSPVAAQEVNKIVIPEGTKEFTLNVKVTVDGAKAIDGKIPVEGPVTKEIIMRAEGPNGEYLAISLRHKGLVGKLFYDLYPPLKKVVDELEVSAKQRKFEEMNAIAAKFKDVKEWKELSLLEKWCFQNFMLEKLIKVASFNMGEDGIPAGFNGPLPIHGDKK